MAYLMLALQMGAQRANGVVVLWVRYALYVLTTPLLIIELGVLAGASASDLFLPVLCDVLMITAGFVASVAPSALAKWALFALSAGFFFAVLSSLVFGLSKGGALAADANAQTVYRFLTFWTVVFLWNGYWIAWILYTGVGAIDLLADVIIHCVLDVFAKSIFGTLLLLSHNELHPVAEGDLVGALERGEADERTWSHAKVLDDPTEIRHSMSSSDGSSASLGLSVTEFSEGRVSSTVMMRNMSKGAADAFRARSQSPVRAESASASADAAGTGLTGSGTTGPLRRFSIINAMGAIDRRLSVSQAISSLRDTLAAFAGGGASATAGAGAPPAATRRDTLPAAYRRDALLHAPVAAASDAPALTSAAPEAEAPSAAAGSAALAAAPNAGPAAHRDTLPVAYHRDTLRAPPSVTFAPLPSPALPPLPPLVQRTAAAPAVYTDPAAYVEAAARGELASVQASLAHTPALLDAHEPATGSTALMSAIAHGRVAVVDALLVAGANKLATNNENRSALMIAAHSGFTALVKRLVAAGAIVNQADAEDMTPLHHAVEGRSLACVLFLAHNGADERAKDARGNMPLDAARIALKGDGDAAIANIVRLLETAPSERDDNIYLPG